jgi:WD40 repeat protein
MVSGPPKVLISYSHDSPKHEQHVLELANRLRADGIDCIIDQYIVATAEGWPLWMDKQIRNSDFVVMVCTETYYQRVTGEEQPGKGLGVRWEGHLIYSEIYRAGTINTKFIPVLFEDGDPSHIPAPVRDADHYFARTERGYEDLYRRLTDQPRALKPDLGKLRSLPQAERKSEGALGRLVNVPDLPPHFFPRLGELQALKDALLAGITKPVALTGTGKIGVQGMGGIGKTVLAAALAHDSEVRQAFPDGIYWLTVGQTPNLLDLQNKLLRQLTGPKQTLTTEEEAKDALRDAIEGRGALVMLDDVWDAGHADAFSATAPPARLLITTRNAEILVGIGAKEHRVDVLSPSDALEMLAELAGERGPDKLPPEATEVAEECGYLPLALALIGAMVRLSSRPTAWRDALARLRRADLQAITRVFPGYPYPNLLRAIEVSIDALESVDHERYLDLAVFPEDQSIPEGQLAILWELDETDTRDCMTRLVNRSLARWVGADAALILHDLQRDLIHKRREKDLPALHLRLVEAWDASPKLDTYAWRRVGYHLAQAGRKGDLQRLLLDFNYLEAKLAATDTAALIADYDYLAVNEELRLIQSAVRLSAHVLAGAPRQLAGQVIGRLLENQASKIQAMLKAAAETKAWPWLRPLKQSLSPPGGPLIRTLEDTGTVNAVAVTPDGRRAVAASGDGTLRLWDLDSGQTLHTLEGHTRRVNAVALTPDGWRALSASEDGTLRLWDLDNGQTLRTLEGHTRAVNAVALTSDGWRAVSASGDGTLRLWDLDNGQTLREIKAHQSAAYAVAAIADGRRVVSGSAGGMLRVWDWESGQMLREIKAHQSAVNAVGVIGTGRRIVSASAGGMLRVWDSENGQRLREIKAHQSAINAIGIAPDGRRSVSASSDRALGVWDLESGERLRSLRGHLDEVRTVAITLEARHAVSGSADGTLRIWDWESGKILRSLDLDSVRAVAVTPKGRCAVSGSAGGTLRVWDWQNGQMLREIKAHQSAINAVAIAVEGRCAISGSAGGTLRAWDWQNGQMLREIKAHQSAINAVAIAVEGRCAISGSAGGMLRAWDWQNGQRLREIKAHQSAINAVAIVADGRCAVSGSAGGMLRAWDWQNGQRLGEIKAHQSAINAVAITPDGRRAISASDDRTLGVWDLESGQMLPEMKAHQNALNAVALTPDGKRVVSGSGHGIIRVWELVNGEEITTFAADGRILGCAVAPDGRTIIAGDESGQVLFLRLIEADKTKLAPGETKIQLLQSKQPGTDS